MLELFITALRQ